MLALRDRVVFKPTLAKVAQAAHHFEVGTRGVEDIGEDRHVGGRLLHLKGEGSGCGSLGKIAVEFMTRESKLIEAEGVEERKGARGFTNDLPQLHRLKLRLRQLKLPESLSLRAGFGVPRRFHEA
jgi:hypothetical protein